jgi:hypothetical protein
MTPAARVLGLAAAIALTAGAAGRAAAQPAAAPVAAETVVPVQPQAPRGSSGEVAKGAAIGLAVGFVLILLIGASASSD